MRKVIQIAMSGHANTSTTQCDVTTIALCNDGTIWGMSDIGKEWLEMPLPPGCGTSDERPIPFGELYQALSVRARNVIFRGDFQMMDELTADALRDVGYCGDKTINEILTWKGKQ
jgi:hypothetical protein